MKVWTLMHIADWEGHVTVFVDEAALETRILNDAEDAAEWSCEPLPDDPADHIGFIIENGWKVHHYYVEGHVLNGVAPTPF